MFQQGELELVETLLTKRTCTLPAKLIIHLRSRGLLEEILQTNTSLLNRNPNTVGRLYWEITNQTLSNNTNSIKC